MKAAEVWGRFATESHEEYRDAYFREAHRLATVAQGGRSPRLKLPHEDPQPLTEIYAGMDWSRLTWIGIRH